MGSNNDTRRLMRTTITRAEWAAIRFDMNVCCGGRRARRRMKALDYYFCCCWSFIICKDTSAANPSSDINALII